MSEQTNTEPEGFGIKETERRQGFEPMPMAVPDEPKDLADIDSKDILAERYKGVSPREAADILMNGEAVPEAEPSLNEPLPRAYIHYGGKHSGEQMPENQTVELDRAARDLSGMREAEQAADETALDAELRQAIDAMRSGDTQQQPEQQQPQPHQQEQPQPEQPAQPVLEGDNIWQDPRVIQGVSEYTKQMSGAFQQAQQQYAAELNATAQLAALSLFNSFPEIAGIPLEQLQGAITAVERQNPGRGAEIRNHINNVNQLATRAQEVQVQQMQAQAAQYRQQFDHVSQLADNAYDNWITQQEPDAGRRQEIRTTAMQILKESGLSDQEISYHWSSSPILRSFAGQQILADAARYRMIRQGIRDKVQRPIPTVQRPGSVSERASDSEYRLHGLEQKLSGSHSVKDAANLLIARRGGRR